MRGRESTGVSRAVRLAVFALLAALLGCLAATPALAKKKKRPPATTVAASASLAPASQAAATANCPGKTHVTGGGWSVPNPYSPNGTEALADDTGARLTHLQSQPAGFFGWTAGAASLAVPPVATTFTTYARCESNAYTSALFTSAGSATVPIGQETTTVIHCPRAGTHVLNAGFSVAPPGDLSDPLNGHRAIVVESRRTAPDAWEVDLVNPSGSGSEVTLSVNVLCEPNRKGSRVTEATAVAPIADNGRTSAAATCTGKTHSVSGGFLLSPKVGPAVGIDQMQPVGNKAWQVGLFEYPNFVLPPGSSVAAYSYCKKNALPKKKPRH